MTSDVPSVQISTTSLVQGSHAPTTVLVQKSGNTLPQDGKVAATPPAAQTNVAQQQAQAAPSPAQQQVDRAVLAAQIAALNKSLNDSGRPAQFRASANNKNIEEVNPSNGKVVAEYPAEEFAELARSVGISGAVINERA
ncbi:MAG TPA: flagellar protein FlaG [Steroidobacteraceae bacterium]